MATTVTYYKGSERYVKSLNMLKKDNSLTTGQCFWAVADFYNKKPADYPRWVHYGKHRGEFAVIDAHVQSFECDLDKMNAVCDWLSEEHIDKEP